jgi:hypothetical protein
MEPAANIHPAAIPPDVLLSQCEVRRLRRSGPGGQHRNKVETAVALHHIPTGINSEANERRSQAENKTEALFRLRVNLALACRHPINDHISPSQLWQTRLIGERIQVNESHKDFPALLAESLDVIAACEADIKTAAESLRCSTSQLIKFLKQNPRAFQLVNQWRDAKTLHKLQ